MFHIILFLYLLGVAHCCLTVIFNRSNSGNMAADFLLEGAFIFAWPICIPIGIVGMYLKKKEAKALDDEEAPDILICPECRAGKHINCDGIAWDFERDEPVVCVCFVAGHRG